MDMAGSDRSRALKRQVTTATPAGLDFRATGVADEGFADTMSTGSPCSIAPCLSADQACNPSCHLQAPEIAGAVGKVAVAAIAVAADEYGGATAGAQVASPGKVHWQSGPMGNRRRRPLREILCRQRRPSGLRGATSGLAWRLGPVSRLRFHRPIDFLPHRRCRRYHPVGNAEQADAAQAR